MLGLFHPTAVIQLAGKTSDMGLPWLVIMGSRVSILEQLP